MFYPYSTHIQELIMFYKYFPLLKHDEKLKSQLKLAETPLKDYLLSEKEKFSSLGFYFMGEKNWGQAIANFKQARKLDERNVAVLMNLASCYTNADDYINEFEVRRKILELDSGNTQNLEALFHLYYEHQKETLKALDIAHNLIKLDDDNPEYYNRRGVAYNTLKQYALAVEDYTKAILLNDKNPNFFANRALTYSKQNDYKNVLTDLTLAIDLEKNADHYFNRSKVYYELLEFDKAVQDLDNAIKINCKDPDFYMDRGIYKAYLGKFDDAKKDFDEGERLAISKEELYHYLSNYFRLKKDFDQAINYLEKSEAILIDFTKTGTRATIYASMGDDKKFYHYLEQAIKEGGEAKLLYIDIRTKYKDVPDFNDLLEKYKQTL